MLSKTRMIPVYSEGRQAYQGFSRCLEYCPKPPNFPAYFSTICDGRLYEIWCAEEAPRTTHPRRVSGNQEQPEKPVRATLVVVPAITLSGCGGVLASLEVIISGGMQSGFPPFIGTAACASTVKKTSPLVGAEKVRPPELRLPESTRGDSARATPVLVVMP